MNDHHLFDGNQPFQTSFVLNSHNVDAYTHSQSRYWTITLKQHSSFCPYFECRNMAHVAYTFEIGDLLPIVFYYVL